MRDALAGDAGSGNTFAVLDALEHSLEHEDADGVKGLIAAAEKYLRQHECWSALSDHAPTTRPTILNRAEAIQAMVDVLRRNPRWGPRAIGRWSFGFLTMNARAAGLGVSNRTNLDDGVDAIAAVIRHAQNRHGEIAFEKMVEHILVGWGMKPRRATDVVVSAMKRRQAT